MRIDRNNISASVGILGGGLSGIVLQHFLKLDSEILEKEDRCGGLCRTWEVDGISADRGPHIIFSRDEETVREMVGILGDNVARHHRRNAIWYHDRFVKYPFENDIHALRPAERFRCLRDFLFNPDEDRKVVNLEDWALRMFGPTLARSYFLPYNEKIWKYPPCELGLDWVERIPNPQRDEMIKSAVGVPTEGYRHQLYFFHPITGGIEALIQAMIVPESKILTNSTVTRIRKEERGWEVYTSSGVRHYEQLTCCMPVQHLLESLDPSPPDRILKAVRRLKTNGLILVLMVFPGKKKPDRFAVYLPDPAILPHRISWVNYLGRNLVPPGYHAVLAEITTHPGIESYSLSDNAIALRVVDSLRKYGIIPKKIKLRTHVLREPLGYVVNTAGDTQNRQVVIDYCREIKIELLGRWAEFEYLNMDMVWKRAKQLAARLSDERR